MIADLTLSRPSYQAGTPVVGTVRIHRAAKTDASAAAVDDGAHQHQQQERPIRDEIVSARLYLAGRAHLGSNSRGKVSRWRSTQEVNQLKKIYGEHACLTMAKMEEKSCWCGWNSGSLFSGSKNNDDSSAVETTSVNHEELPISTKASSFCKTIQPPQVTHIEQGERYAVHSCLNHNSSSYRTNYSGGSGDPNAQNQQPSNDYSHLPTTQDNNAICLWMTNVLELLDIPERHLDRKCTCNNAENCQCQLRPGRGKFHGDMNPYRPLQLPDLDVVRDVWKGIEKKMSQTDIAVKGKAILSIPTSDNVDASGTTESCNEETINGVEQNMKDGEKVESSTTGTDTKAAAVSPWDQIVASANPARNDASSATNESAHELPLEKMQLALSFRADLPPDVPPTMSAECVKYFYSAVLVITNVEGELLVTQCPFSVLTSNTHRPSSQQSHQTSTTRVHIGDLYAIAHSAALPTYISSTEASDATHSQLTVIANPPACDIVSRRTAEQRTSTHRIEDGNGYFCGLMTLVGIGGPLIPGTRLGIRIQFPIYEDDEKSNGAGIIPCHRVCCALVGEEYAIFEGSSASTTGADSLQKSKKRVKTRSYVFDSAYEMVEFGYTEAISMGLVLPLDCPVTVKTDLVEVTVMLKVEFTVSRKAITSQSSDEVVDGRDQGEFSSIRLDLPCEVVHGNEGSTGHAEDGGEEERRVSSIRTMQQFWKNNNKSEFDDGFDDTDIQTDLRMLSLRMIGELH